MKLSKNKTIILVLLFVLVLFLVIYVLMNRYKEGLTNITKTWKFDQSAKWHTIKQNGFNIKFKDMGFTQYANVSFSFLLKIKNVSNNWRNIFHVTNTNNNWGTPGDRAPAVWIFPDNTTRLHMRFSTNVDQNDGLDTSYLPNLYEPVFITMVFNGNNFKHYLNGMLVDSRDYGSIVPRIPDTILYIGDPWHFQDDGIQVRNFTVYEGALTDADINDIYDSVMMGPKGPAGPAGPAGAAGAVGPAGPAGPAGAAGAAGKAGAAGPAGAAGAAGAAGKAGPMGPTGPAGPSGVAGAPAVAGPSGVVGVAGAAGPSAAATQNSSGSLNPGTYQIAEVRNS